MVQNKKQLKYEQKFKMINHKRMDIRDAFRILIQLYKIVNPKLKRFYIVIVVML